MIGGLLVKAKFKTLPSLELLELSESLNMSAALIVFAKAPIAGKVKTRLTPFLSPKEAAQLYAAFLQDALALYGTLNCDIRLYLASEADILPTNWLPPRTTLHIQQGKDLGERMLTAFVETFLANYKKILIVGSDHPTLPLEFIEAGFDALLDKKSVVLGGSEDGGYYLLGMNELYGEVFEDMTYSHDQVFEDTLDRIDETDANLCLLPEWYDVDVPDDLFRLSQDLLTSPLPLVYTRKILPKLLATKR